ncbi:MAG: glyoxalase superfamily protein [Pseudomonadota bacterium]
MKPPIPILRIFDEAKAREFYLDYLGFAVVFEHRFDDDAPLYMEVRRGDCVLHLSEHSGDATPGAAVRIEVEDVRALHAELAAKTYKYANPSVEPMPWGLDEMSIADNFGNRLVFY